MLFQVIDTKVSPEVNDEPSTLYDTINDILMILIGRYY